MFKKIFIVLSLLNLNNLLLSNENENGKRSEKSQMEEERPLKKTKKEFDFFILRFQADNEEEENEVNNLFEVYHFFNSKKRESKRLLEKKFRNKLGNKYIHFELGKAKKIDPKIDFIENLLWIVFLSSDFYYDLYSTKFKIDPNNFIPNQDIFIPVPEEYNCFKICINILDNNFIRERYAHKTFVIKPGKKYIVKFRNFSRNIADNDIEVEIHDIQEDQIKMRNELNDILANVPIDVNNIISEYVV